MEQIKRSMITISGVLMLAMICSGNCWGKDGRPLVKKIPSNNLKAEQFIKDRSQPVIGDGGSSGVYNPGVDLVVSKVVIQRGQFGSDPSQRLQIIPYVRNMWEGSTSKRIKVLFDGLSRAIWLEGGIGSREEKSAGAIYLPNQSTLNFDVVVDNDNAIIENNERNNRCENVRLGATVNRLTFNCRIVGPHEGLE